MEFAFWAAFTFVAYTYLGYPLLIWVGASLRRATPVHTTASDWLPDVRVVIAVHNEERRVASKVRNLLAQDYPPERVHIVFVCDGCTDRTEAVLRECGGVEVLVSPVRRGKPNALNLAMSQAHESVIVFTDVRQEVVPGAIRALVERLNESDVGAVSGELVHRETGSAQSAHIGLYWRYEKAIRKGESRLFSTVGATGALYAMRREHVAAIREDTLLDDVEIPIRVLRKGLRIVLEERAVIWDDVETEIEGEFRRKVRTLAGNVQLAIRNGWLFVPWKCPVVFQFVSHKVCRLLVPYALVVAFVTAWASDGALYRWLAVAQTGAYALAAVGSVSTRLRSLPLVSVLVVFAQLNAAAVVALVNYARGAASVQWRKAA